MNEAPLRIDGALSDDEFEELEGLLAGRSPFDVDGVMGVMHAVAVAPSMIVPSRWLTTVMPEGLGAADSRTARRAVELLLRLYNDVIDALEHKQTMVPEQDDAEACESFAAGFAAAAELDSEWTGNADRWTFASAVAYLGGRLDLVPAELRTTLDAQPDAKATVRAHLAAIVVAARDSFQNLRRGMVSATTRAAPARPPRGRVGRNDPCPCGSGKKYKRCCLDRGHASGAG